MPELDFAPLRALIGDAAVTPMPGGASTRRYFRVERADGAKLVAMFVPEGAKPEEIAKDGVRARWPFLEVRDLLAARDLAAADEGGAGLVLHRESGRDPPAFGREAIEERLHFASHVRPVDRRAHDQRIRALELLTLHVGDVAQRDDCAGLACALLDCLGERGGVSALRVVGDQNLYRHGCIRERQQQEQQRHGVAS
jgi:hypothetical protein